MRLARSSTFPVIDLFAGPGGLADGFSAFMPERGRRGFRVVLSIEKDAVARETLRLRKFVRGFPDPPDAYFSFLQGEIRIDELYGMFPKHAKTSDGEAWRAELGRTDEGEVDARIRAALGMSTRPWILIGGPPCQAYSLVGRSRMMNLDGFESDERHFLYMQYLRILAVHHPDVFVMENVKGILSAKLQGVSIFQRILRDLRNPQAFGRRGRDGAAGYRLYGLASTEGCELIEGCSEVADFVLRAERHGIPQARHRVFVVGVRQDRDGRPTALQPAGRTRCVQDVLGSLPPLRSRLSRRIDSWEVWCEAVREIGHGAWMKSAPGTLLGMVAAEVKCALPSKGAGELAVGAPFLEHRRQTIGDKELDDWYRGRCRGLTLHETRGHMVEDLHRYLFASCFARVAGRSPTLRDYPKELRPDHRNVDEAVESGKFSDRFRVQLADQPARTVTSHISKDGHYFIHYDPLQCRSLTVREAARLQTFPDDYFFCGNRTQQYHQVGNAVPPLLGMEVAGAVHGILEAALRAR